jgi:hypothetical protein
VFGQGLVGASRVCGVRSGGIFKLSTRRLGDVVGTRVGFLAVVAWHGRMIPVGLAGVAGQALEVFGPSGDVAGVEVGQAVGGAEAVDGIVVVSPEVLLVGFLSNDVGWEAITVYEALVGWELLSVL